MSDNIHKTHFPVTKEMPWREKEKQAILLFKWIIEILEDSDLDNVDTVRSSLDLLSENENLVKWVKNYNG